MVLQRIRQSGSAYRAKPASSIFRGRWWGIVVALVVGGATAYLLPGLADDKRATEGRSPTTTLAPSIASRNNTHSPALPTLTGRWQSVPLLASQNSTDVIADGEVKVLSLQTAFERERDRADAAQREVLDLHEQLASLKETEALMVGYRSAAIGEQERADSAVLREATLQEELANLRASIIDAQKAAGSEKEKAISAHKQLEVVEGHLTSLKGVEAVMAEYRSAAISEKERADEALLRVSALHEDLANLRTSIVEAQKAAEYERERATYALEELEIVKDQLAMLTALERDRIGTKSQLQPKQDQVVTVPLLEGREKSRPEDLAPQQPSRLMPPTPPLGKKRKPERDVQPGNGKSVRSATDRQASLPSRVGVLTGLGNDAASTPMLSRRRQPEPERSRDSKLGQSTRSQGVRPVGKAPMKIQQPRVLAQDIRDLRSPRVLSLPRALLPDSRLW